MTRRDPNECRRALQEIGEVAAVAALQDSQMTDQEALQIIGATAQWVGRDGPGPTSNCGAVVRQIHEATAGVVFEGLSDDAALALFRRVLDMLSSSDTAHPRLGA